MKKQIKYILALVACLCSWTLSAQDEAPESPANLEFTAHQHEIDLRWDEPEDEVDSWRIVLGDKVFETSRRNYTIDGLEADTSYEVEVYAIKDGVDSEPVTQTIKTAAMRFGVDDLRRIPYLRTVSVQGKCPELLPLYYNDLAHLKAKISYKLNGKEITPERNHIRLNPNSVRETLEININEGEGKEWRIIYYLHVKK